MIPHNSEKQNLHMRLYKMGYITIPLVGKHRADGVSGWGDWAQDGIPESEVIRFDRDYPLAKFGIGLVAGPASNNIVLPDIDSVDPEVIALVPRSPLERIGMRGLVPVFKNPDGIGNCTPFNRKNKNLAIDPTGKPEEEIEIRASGMYVAIPPTVHPDSGIAYRWKDNKLEDFNPDYIPPLLWSHIEHIQSFGGDTDQGRIELSGVFTHRDNSRCPHGSHNRLKVIAAALVSQRRLFSDAADELLRYDQEHHKPIGYFEDRTRTECKADPRSNAIKFYSNILHSINRNHIRKREPIELPDAIETLTVVDIVSPAKNEEQKYPEVGGMISMFRDAILSISRADQSDMALGAALAIGGTLAANRFHINNRPAYTSMYILNVAGTGAGKGAAIDFINAFFGPNGIGAGPDFRLLGLSNYSSDVAMINDLPKKRTRLDVIDEFGQVFKGLAAKGDHKSTVGEALKVIFSAKAYFNGHYTKTSGMVGRCVTPSISLLGTIQPETLMSNSSPEVLFDGFMGRFLYFMENTAAAWTGRHLSGGLDRSVLDHISSACLEVYPANPQIEIDMVGNLIEDVGERHFTRTELKYAPGYVDAYTEFDKQHYYSGVAKRDAGEELAAKLQSRSIEIASKIAIILCASEGERVITLQHFETALAIVELSTKRSSQLLIGAGSPVNEKLNRKVLDIIKRRPGGVCERRVLMQFSHLPAKTMDATLHDLIEMGSVKEVQVSGSNARHYQAC